MERVSFAFHTKYHFRFIAGKPLSLKSLTSNAMEKPFLQFLLQLSQSHFELLCSAKIMLEKYRSHVCSQNLSLSDFTVQKYNYALIMVTLICKDYRISKSPVNAKDLLSISEALCYVQKSLVFHSPITTVTLYRVIDDQVTLINSIINDFLGDDC